MLCVLATQKGLFYLALLSAVTVLKPEASSKVLEIKF